MTTNVIPIRPHNAPTSFSISRMSELYLSTDDQPCDYSINGTSEHLNARGRKTYSNIGRVEIVNRGPGTLTARFV